jgi:hypothetical protein
MFRATSIDLPCADAGFGGGTFEKLAAFSAPRTDDLIDA